LSGIKKLAGQTAIYGLSTILGRFLNVFLTFWLTYVYGAEEFAVFTLAYAYVTFLNVIFTYGMETSYFRFIQNPQYKHLAPVHHHHYNAFRRSHGLFCPADSRPVAGAGKS
jgi:Kef-type K+ transport system membrane component KefB